MTPGSGFRRIAAVVRPDSTLVADGGRRFDADDPADGTLVLVVDDDEGFAETIRIWLEPEMTVRVALDGEEGVEAYDPHVDVVLLDRRMPTPGDQVLDRIRAAEGDASVAMMTATPLDRDVVDRDFDLYLQKPVTRDEVVETVELLLGRER